MERYRRATQSYNNGLPPRPPLQSRLPSHLSLKTKVRELPLSDNCGRISRWNDDTELSIFEAESYFSDKHESRDFSMRRTIVLHGMAAESCELSTSLRDPSISSTDGYGRCYPTGSFATPISSSEASWNSQSGLLSKPVRSLSIKDHARGTYSTGRRLLGRNCPCSGEKSIDVEEYSEPKSPIGSKDETGEVCVSRRIQISAAKEINLEVGIEEVNKMRITPGNYTKGDDFIRGSTLFSLKETPFPAETGKPLKIPNGFSFPILKPPQEESPRDSLEVFRQKDDDQCSDASSDLFEIESFSTSCPTASCYRRRDSIDELLERAAASYGAAFRWNVVEDSAPSELNYAPSEVSVQWSVTTAEGFDRGSVANVSTSASSCGETGGAAPKRRGGGGSLLSCRCEKAVNVGPSPVRTGPDRSSQVSAVYAVEPGKVKSRKVARSNSDRIWRPVQMR
ncbi:protein PHYTOCHROME KINASE SUBSTRATE 4-like [Typha latifolia]|uniref:protein PHYTOCHROME KINASE SUBSTRATE 4-like n=1 Tax=Typha latifolia TaxID=4733 RepID=UPI003C2E86FC